VCLWDFRFVLKGEKEIEEGGTLSVPKFFGERINDPFTSGSFFEFHSVARLQKRQAQVNRIFY
jgi:hypothetical protein